MPKLLQRGCALEGCHSPDGFNDFRIRSGSKGSFAPLALRRNYEALLHEFMALDTADVKQSRAVKKNIIASSGGTVHRAGAILEDSVPIETACPQPFDAATSTRAFCVFKEWHRLERADRGAAVSPMTAGSTLPLAFVSRTPNGDDLLHFDTHAGGADLKLADATVDANGSVTGVANIRSALAPCAGLTAGRRPGRPRPRVELRLQQAGVRRPPGRGQRPRPVAARRRGRDVPAADQRRRPAGGPGARPQLRPRVRARRQRRLRVDAVGVR